MPCNLLTSNPERIKNESVASSDRQLDRSEKRIKTKQIKKEKLGQTSIGLKWEKNPIKIRFKKSISVFFYKKKIYFEYS